MQFLLITSTQLAVANDPITSVAPPSLSPPHPLHLLSSLPLPFVFPIAHPLLLTVLCGGRCDSADVSAGAHPTEHPPGRASEYLLACLSLFLSFGPRCPLTRRTRSSLLCSHHLQSSPNTAGLMMNFISTQGSWMGLASESQII